MTNVDTGDVVLLRFPFTDMSSSKRRPALVLNPSSFVERYGDVVVLPLTGRTQDECLRLAQWQRAGLLKPTWVKPLIATLSASLIDTHLGELAPEDTARVTTALSMLIDNRYCDHG